MIEGIIPTEIRGEAEAIRATLAASLPSARAAANALRAAGTRRIYVIGNGTSYHSALAAATWYRHRAAADQPTVIALPAGEFRHYLPALGPGDAMIGISASGEFRDVIALVEELRGRLPTLGIVHVPGSSLERLADYAVLSAGGPSRVPVMTKTYASTLTATLLVVAELLGERASQETRDALAQAADHVESAVAAAEPRVSLVVERLSGCEHLFVVGGGTAAAAAAEAALKLKEMALVHAEAAESWEMASGAATIVGPGSAVVALAPAGEGREATLDLARRALAWGATVVEVGPGADAEPGLATPGPDAGRGSAIPDALHLPLDPSAAEDLSPLTAVAPVALLAFALARARGADPDRPAWVERYHSLGMRHIVGV